MQRTAETYLINLKPVAKAPCPAEVATGAGYIRGSCTSTLGEFEGSPNGLGCLTTAWPPSLSASRSLQSYQSM